MTETRTPRVLLVDDDVDLCTMLSECLGAEGFRVNAVHEGTAALDAWDDGIDLVVLDVMLPGMNGLDVLRRLRGSSDIPVLMLTARGDDTDRIVGLELGADDYLPKPFNPRELVARLRALLRRAERRFTRGRTSLTVDNIHLDSTARTARIGVRPLKLTGAEFCLLEALMRRPGVPISRDELTREVLGRELSPYDRSIDTHVSNLRRKLAAAQPGDSPILNVRGKGYLLRVADEPNP